MRVPVAARTLVLVNGVPASLSDVKPGFVAEFTGLAGRAARVLKALDPPPVRTVGAATVQSVSAAAVVVTGADGSTVTIPVDARTRVLVDGNQATLADVRPGDRIWVGSGASSATRPVRELRFRRPG